MKSQKETVKVSNSPENNRGNQYPNEIQSSHDTTYKIAAFAPQEQEHGDERQRPAEVFTQLEQLPDIRHVQLLMGIKT